MILVEAVEGLAMAVVLLVSVNEDDAANEFANVCVGAGEWR